MFRVGKKSPRSKSGELGLAACRGENVTAAATRTNHIRIGH